MENYPKILISGDYNAFKEGYNSAGIYAFSGIAQTPSFETPIYIGSAKDEKKRIVYFHIPKIKKEAHFNDPLQNYIYKYGWENIVVFELEKVEADKDILVKAEQKWIDHYGIAANGEAFNINPKACTHMGHKLSEDALKELRSRKMSPELREILRKANTGRKISEVTREKLRAWQRGEKSANWGKKASEERKLKTSIALKGRKHTEEHIRKRAITQAKPFKLIGPSGEIINGVNLRDFARENNLSQPHLWSVINGRRDSHKGYKAG